MVMATNRPPSPEERERELIEATERYMRDEISQEELEAVEERNQVDYRAALRSINRGRLGWRWFLSAFI